MYVYMYVICMYVLCVYVCYMCVICMCCVCSCMCMCVCYVCVYVCYVCSCVLCVVSVWSHHQSPYSLMMSLGNPAPNSNRLCSPEACPKRYTCLRVHSHAPAAAPRPPPPPPAFYLLLHRPGCSWGIRPIKERGRRGFTPSPSYWMRDCPSTCLVSTALQEKPEA